jgi:DNA-binding transcriptional MocR family regulator
VAERIPDAAIWKQIAGEVRAKIADGTLRPGQRIGTVAALAHEYRIGTGTIRRVMDRLRFEGLVVGEPGEVPRVREMPEVVWVKVPRGADMPPARLPTEAECRELGIAGGVWVRELIYGGRTTLYVDDRTHFTFA